MSGYVRQHFAPLQQAYAQPAPAPPAPPIPATPIPTPPVLVSKIVVDNHEMEAISLFLVGGMGTGAFIGSAHGTAWAIGGAMIGVVAAPLAVLATAGVVFGVIVGVVACTTRR